MAHRNKVSSWESQRTKLAAQIRACLAPGGTREINLSIPRHSVTAPVLRRFAFDPTFRGKELLVVFQDTSRPEPFPLGTLGPDGVPPVVGEVVKLGLSSFRHPDLEFLVDLYFTRNRDLNDESSMAGTEKLSYGVAIAMLSDPALRDGGQIWVFHTGLEPMVVGFYRGVWRSCASGRIAACPGNWSSRPGSTRWVNRPPKRSARTHRARSWNLTSVKPPGGERDRPCRLESHMANAKTAARDSR